MIDKSYWIKSDELRSIDTTKLWSDDQATIAKAANMLDEQNSIIVLLEEKNVRLRRVLGDIPEGLKCMLGDLDSWRTYCPHFYRADCRLFSIVIDNLTKCEKCLAAFGEEGNKV